MNGLEPAESRWTFGQIFAMINLFSLANMLFSQAKPRILSTAKWMVSDGDGETNVDAITFWSAFVITHLIFIPGWKYMYEWDSSLSLGSSLSPTRDAYEMSAVYFVFIVALMLSPLLVVTAAEKLVEWSNSTASPTFGAIVKSCSLVFRPFGYALGIIEEETHEEETGSTLNQLNV